jgi:uroporphyrinogen-III synthase
MRLLVTRPQPDADRFALALAEIGAAAVVAPLMSIEVDESRALELDGCDALAFTSANGVRALARLAPNCSLPAYMVGPASARVAENHGIRVAGVAGGNVESLAALITDAIPAGSRIFHAAGADIAGDLATMLEARDISCTRQVLYKAMIPEQLPAEISQHLRAGALDGAVFFSPRSARSFVRLVTNAGQASACAGLTLFGLSPAVTEAACETIVWRRVREAQTPTQEALIDTIRAVQSEYSL